MSKAPAFQLYVNDFDSDTAAWSCEEIGIYMRLLFYQWVNGSIPDDPARMARICRIGLRTFLIRWASIQVKFIPTGEGQLQNARLEKTRLEQSQYIEMQREKGRKRAAKMWEGHIAAAINRLQPEDSSSSSSLTTTTTTKDKEEKKETRKKEKPTIQPDADAYRLAALLFGNIIDANPDSRLSALNNGGREGKIQQWARDIDLLLRIDQRDPSTVEEVIVFATHDDFWGPNVMSGHKLREKWDTLTAQMKRTGRIFKHSAGVMEWLRMTDGKEVANDGEG